VQCLDLGADDSMGEPFFFAELFAIRALLAPNSLTGGGIGGCGFETRSRGSEGWNALEGELS